MSYDHMAVAMSPVEAREKANKARQEEAKKIETEARPE